MQRVRVDDFLRYTYISDLVACPDKSKCAFVTTHCNINDNNYKSYIHILDSKTKVVKQVTFFGHEKNITWLDNETLIFISKRDPHIKEKIDYGEEWTCFYKLSLLGGEAEPFIFVPRKVKSIFPLEDGTIAMVAEHSIDEPDFSIMSKEEKKSYYTNKKKMEESYVSGDEIPFRKEGEGITNNKRWGLYIYDPTTSEYSLITKKTETIEFIEVNRYKDKIIYSTKEIFKNKPKEFLSGISIYDVNEKRSINYIDDETYRMRYCGFIKDTPVFMGSDGKKYGYQQNPDFYLIEEEGKERVFYYNDDSASNSTCTDIRYGKLHQIQTDDNFIYYVGMEGGNAQLYRISLDGSRQQITDEHGSVESFALLEDKIVFIGLRKNKLQELYLYSKGREVQLTGFNEWVQEQRSLSKVEEVAFVNEDVNIEGYILKPVDFEKGKKYPCILYIHGGHKLSFSPVFYHELQLFANEGYFVLFCNPRGSDGYGNEFADIIGEYGYSDYDDLMAFTDYCIDKYPEIDEERLGVGGGSYGGYMTNWIIGHTNRFACAVSQRSISNFISMFGTSDTNYQFPMYQFKTNIWMDINRYWDHSPLKYAENVSTPTLFIHAEDDYRCPISKGMQMFLALKYHGVESKLCIFKKEGHELSRSGRPFNRLNRLNEIIGWFNQYLSKTKK